MKEGPDIASVAAMIGDSARANMLTALMSGKALTATELAGEAGVTAQTASAHLGKLVDAGLLTLRRQGRHRYFALAEDDVGVVLEGLMGLTAARERMRTRTGPRDPGLRRARVCYNPLAGELAVEICERLRGDGRIVETSEDVTLTDAGRAFFGAFCVDLAPLERARRPLCRSCLDWSMRRTHLAGGLGTAILDRIHVLGWARREPVRRVVPFTREGERALWAAFAN